MKSIIVPPEVEFFAVLRIDVITWGENERE
jgi:hypothetical protein